ncbi:MAG: LacI family DNA-binding transcriptional regulator [Pseudomonadota bacterium]
MPGPTLKDVAQRAGVSRSAVSRTFTEGASVSEKMRAKVIEAADELGYSPNALASSLTTGRTKLIGLIANNFQNPIFLEIFDRFTRRLQERGLRPLLVNLTDQTDPNASVRMMRTYSVDGVVVASSTLPPVFAKAFRDAGIPVVHSFGRYTTRPRVHIVGIDNVECGRMAATELLHRGYKRVAFLGGPESATSTQDRLQGFGAEIAKHPGVEMSHSFANGYTFQAGRQEMLRLIERGMAEAYFCGDDIVAMGALSALEDRGHRIPNDVGIIGLNDMEMAGWESINLTTIQQPVSEIIDTSVALITSLLDLPDARPKARLFGCKVIERGTLRAKP